MSKKMRVSPHETMDTGMYAGIKNGKEMFKTNKKPSPQCLHLKFPFTV